MEYTDLTLMAKRGHGSVPVETYRGREIYRTADLQMVTVPASDTFCVENLRESDAGPTLHTEASVDAVRAFLDDEAEEALVAALSAAIGYMRNARIDLETGATKATAIRTIDGGIQRAEAALAKAKGGAS